MCVHVRGLNLSLRFESGLAEALFFFTICSNLVLLLSILCCFFHMPCQEFQLNSVFLIVDRRVVI